MQQATANSKEVRKQLRALEEFASAVGLKLKREPQDDGSLDLVLYDKTGEPLCTEFDCEDMAYSIYVYAGSNANYKAARQEYDLHV